jgi:hypothetical protein
MDHVCGGICKKQTGGVLFVLYAFDPKPTNKGTSCENLSVQGPLLCLPLSSMYLRYLRPSMHFGGMDKSDWWFVNLQKGRLFLHFKS